MKIKLIVLGIIVILFGITMLHFDPGLNKKVLKNQTQDINLFEPIRINSNISVKNHLKIKSDKINSNNSLLKNSDTAADYKEGINTIDRSTNLFLPNINSSIGLSNIPENGKSKEETNSNTLPSVFIEFDSNTEGVVLITNLDELKRLKENRDLPENYIKGADGKTYYKITR